MSRARDIADGKFSGDLEADSPTFVVDAANNRVGVGRSNPSETLDVQGNILILNAGNPTMTVKASGAGNNPSYILAADTNSWNISGIFSESNDPIQFAYNSSEKLRIENSGKVAVNGTSTNGIVTVKETSFNPNVTLGNSAIMVYGGYGGGIVLIDSSNPNSGPGYAIWTDDSGNDFNIAGGGTGTAASGGVYINNNAGSWSSRSDERDKVNLAPITDAATKVQSLRAVIGEYVWAEGVRHPFLIAQDVQAVLPEAVSIANKSAPEEDQRLGMSYTDMVPLLTAALQEALTEIAQLKADVAALKGA